MEKKRASSSIFDHFDDLAGYRVKFFIQSVKGSSHKHEEKGFPRSPLLFRKRPSFRRLLDTIER